MNLTHPMIRSFLYIVLLSILPLIFIILHSQRSSLQLKQLSNLILFMQEKVAEAKIKLSFNKDVIDFYREKDRFYIQKKLQPMILLKEEKHRLEKLDALETIAKDPKITQRLQKIRNDQMLFSEGSVTKNGLFQEIPYSLLRPVEVDEKDLLNILSLLEGSNIGSEKVPLEKPHIMITDFKLERKQTILNEEIFQLNLKLIKREYL